MFSNNSIIKWLKQDFVPVAISVSYLQEEDNRDGLLFRKIAEQGHYAGRTKPTPTRQGLYIATIDGTLLASANTNSPIEVLQLMQKGINGWNRGRKNSAGKFSTTSAKPTRHSTVEFPEGGLILRQTVRDLPRPGEPSHKTDQHNFDHVWMTPEEIKAFAPSSPEPGFSYDIPRKIAHRLVRFSLVDQVKGESDAWSQENIVGAWMKAKVTQVKTSESGSLLVRIKLDGKAKCVCPASGEVNPFTKHKINTSRGIEAKIKGFLTYDTQAKTFTDFDMIAFGQRWGTATYSFRHRDLGRAPIGFAFQLLETKPENMTKPAFGFPDYFSYQK